MARTGNLRSLQVLDRPAVLRFLNGKSLSVYVALIGLQEDKATLVLDTKRVEVPVAELESRWFGEYTIIWRAPPSFNGSIRLGSQGKDVQWLASRLASVTGSSVTSNKPVSYDDNLIQQVKTFQQRQGLESDGIAGIQTLIRLNSVTDRDVPRITEDTIRPGPPDKTSAGAVEQDNDRLSDLINRVNG